LQEADDVDTPGIAASGDAGEVARKKERTAEEKSSGRRIRGAVSPSHRAPLFSPSDRQGSAIELDLGPPIDATQSRNYRTIQMVRIHSSLNFDAITNSQPVV
jgi:hypothetical protein